MRAGLDDKATFYQHENIDMKNETLPINIRQRTTDHKSFGCEFHWHEELEFYYVEKGGVLLSCNGKQEWVLEGQIGFVNWCQMHKGVKFLDGTRHYIVQIGTNLFSEEKISLCQKEENVLLTLISHNKNFPLVICGNKLMNKALEQIIFSDTNKEFAYQLKIKAAVLIIIEELLVNSGIDKSVKNTNSSNESAISLEHVKMVLFFISGNYMFPEKVTLEELGKRFGLSIPYLCRIFKKYTHMTVGEYLQKLRCSHAISFIQNGSSLESISDAVGIQDYNYFCRMFKKTVGLSPSKYRNSL